MTIPVVFAEIAIGVLIVLLTDVNQTSRELYTIEE